MNDRVPSDCLQRSWMLRNIHEQKGSRELLILGFLFPFFFEKNIESPYVQDRLTNLPNKEETMAIKEVKILNVV